MPCISNRMVRKWSGSPGCLLLFDCDCCWTVLRFCPLLVFIWPTWWCVALSIIMIKGYCNTVDKRDRYPRWKSRAGRSWKVCKDEGRRVPEIEKEKCSLNSLILLLYRNALSSIYFSRVRILHQWRVLIFLLFFFMSGTLLSFPDVVAIEKNRSELLALITSRPRCLFLVIALVLFFSLFQ